jgi:hypothetical protein
MDGPLILRPIRLRAARAFVAAHHRHSRPPRGWLFGVALERDGELVGVAIAGRPLARGLDDGATIEVTRSCVLEGQRNANSRLYGAICRAAAALGYRSAVTYTLELEGGASLLAAGFRRDGEPLGEQTWARPSRPRYASDLWGEALVPAGDRQRWRRDL